MLGIALGHGHVIEPALDTANMDLAIFWGRNPCRETIAPRVAQSTAGDVEVLWRQRGGLLPSSVVQ